MIAMQGEVRGGAVALEEGGRAGMSYGELSGLVVSLVGDMRRVGVKRADRVAVVIPNGRDMSTTLLGVCSAAIAAPLNPAYREDEFADYFREIRVSFLVIRRGVESPARVAAAKMGIKVIELTEDAGALLPEGQEVRPETPTEEGDLPDPDDIALILLTSGSTGRSKKVPLTHRNICVSVRDTCRTLELTPDDRCLCMWEQFHIGGLVDLLMVPLASGGSVICTGGFDASRFFELLPAKSPTWYQGVPATVHELMAHARKHGIAAGPNTLRFIRVTASALAPKLMGELEEYFGVPVITTFGMTEAAPLITTNLLPPHARKAGSTGPSCGPEVAVMDAEGNLLKTGEVGEVVVRGDNVMSGYEDAPEANAHSFRYGWFHTGDTGCLDEDGYLFLKGRIKESINRGGEKITPQEIDDVLLTHPGIAEAISFHIPHSVLGEDVAVAVVLHKPGSLSENDIRDYVAARLAEFKVPRKVLFVDGFTRGPSGKVNRSALADALGVTAEKSYEAPVSPLEQTLADIWARELNIPRVGRNDTFADLGGDSLSTARMIHEVEKSLGRRLSIEVLSMMSIGTATIQEIAGAIPDEQVDLVRSSTVCVPEESAFTVPSGRRLYYFGILLARFLESVLPAPMLRIALWPAVAVSAFRRAWLFRRHDWKSSKLPDALRNKGSNLIFLWRMCEGFYYRQILTCFSDRLSCPRWKKRVRVEGLERLLPLVEQQQPVMLSTIHFGHINLLKYLLHTQGIDAAEIVVRGPKNLDSHRIKDSFINRTRSSNPISADLMANEVSRNTRYLSEGNVILMAIDARAGNQLSATVCGACFEMGAGAIQMARMAGAKLVPCILKEEYPWKFVIQFGDVMPALDQESFPDDQTAADALAEFFWPIVCEDPSQYDCGQLVFWKSNIT
jgi:acyl-CoA synthetase (AMP-forming)/AMP-acid ligase II/acyl carrier protein